ncbi:MAG TPA: YkgJ family cysteine cluster protein, partial [Chitinophagaceae bacterium]|nr:YkgJ family cysteine cluster protein [Chitinophagaceae bacterium]
LVNRLTFQLFTYLRPMSEMKPVNLRSFKKKMRLTKRSFRRFLTKLEKDPPKRLKSLTIALEKEVWQEVDCLSCANCCKTMTPTFNKADLLRISAHFDQTVDEFKKQWLYKERKKDGDWLNKKQPCQFLNLKDNKCSIYEIRPADCAGFPHLTKKFSEYAHVHKQNIEYCPATYKLVEKMMKSSGLIPLSLPPKERDDAALQRQTS